MGTGGGGIRDEGLRAQLRNGTFEGRDGMSGWAPRRAKRAAA